MARIRSARQLRTTRNHRPSASNVIRRQQTANTPGGLANRAQRAVAYRGARELNYARDQERTPLQQRIDRVTGVTRNGGSPRVEVGYRANRMAQAVRAFASAQPTGGTVSNSPVV